MIFQKELIKQVLAERKTQASRPVRDGEASCQFKVGRTYGVQSSHTKPAIARITVTSVQRGRISDYTDADAALEGFKNLELFTEWWGSLFPVDPADEVWKINFLLERAQPIRLLHRQSHKGYTDNHRLALADEPEAVDDSTLARYVTENRQGDLARHVERRARWERKAVGNRVERLLDSPTLSGYDKKRLMGLVRSMESKLNKAA